MPDYTLENVPDEVRKIRLVGVLTIEVLGVGPMNHISYFANVHPDDANNDCNTIRWAMNVLNPTASVGSNEAQYAASIGRSELSSLSDFSTRGKPLPLSDTSSIATRPSVISDNSSSAPRDGSFQDAGSDSTDSAIFAPLPEGAPALGRLDIKVRGYGGKSISAVEVFTFHIIDEPTFGHFLDALVTRGMFPFYFRKLGFAFLGCRHFAAEAFEAWKAAHLVEDVCTTAQKYFRDVIGIRYSPLENLPANLLQDSDDEEATKGMRQAVNPIDKGYFPEGFEPLSDGYPYA
ncbi:hypothetical protein V8E53_012879 [Lactarius tabidus]